MSQRLAILTRFHRRVIYAITFALWASGAAWVYYQKFGHIHDEFGTSAAPAQAMVLRIHGAAAMLFLILFGSLLPLHMRPGWRQGDHRISGGSMVGSCLILILTGWGLYYIGNEGLRHSASLLHTYLGLVLPVFLVLHIVIARHKRRHLAATHPTPHS